MICATQDASGAIWVVVPTPTPVDASTCPLVVTIYEEAMKSSMFHLTMEQGAQVGAAILLVWGVAYALRMIADSIRTTWSSNDESSS